MKFSPTIVLPEKALAEYLQGKVKVVTEDGEEVLTVYPDWERPTNGLPDDFITIAVDGNPSTVAHDVDYTEGYLALSLYCKLNDDGSVKIHRVNKIISQFDTLIDRATIDEYFFKFELDRYITPTTPSESSGYSITTLSLFWHTIDNFNK